MLKGKGETMNRVNPVYKVIILLNYVNVNGFGMKSDYLTRNMFLSLFDRVWIQDQNIALGLTTFLPPMQNL